MSTDLIARLRARKTATAWTRGIDTDYPTAWAPDPDCQDAATALEQQAAEIARMQGQCDKLKTVMIAAAEEISAHWDAHCDAEGYGPVNLQRRLEEGIPSEYGYTAGAFAALKAERDALRVDAERYRYLRNRVPVEVFDARGIKAGAWIDCEDDAGQLTLLTGEDADQTIEAARAAREST